MTKRTVAGSIPTMDSYGTEDSVALAESSVM